MLRPNTHIYNFCYSFPFFRNPQAVVSLCTTTLVADSRYAVMFQLVLPQWSQALYSLIKTQRNLYGTHSKFQRKFQNFYDALLFTHL